MVTDNERREVARRLRELNDSELQVYNMTYFAIQRAVGGEGDQYPDGWELTNRLADLIDPPDGFDLDTVQRVCFECMEGCDEPEWTLYSTIYDAIARYKRGESGPMYDYEALVSLANEYERFGLTSVSRRIRKALGASDDVIDFEDEMLRKSHQSHGYIFFCGEYQPDYMVDREALMKLVDDMKDAVEKEQDTGLMPVICAESWSIRILMALGEVDDGQE